MTSIIKFRAFNNKKNVMADYVSSIQNGDTKGTPSSVNVIVNGKNETWNIKNDDVRLMQYTGFHDKNGSEIYEGDLLRTDGYDDDKKLLETYWNKSNGAYAADGFFLSTVVKHSLVIGNIYKGAFKKEQLNRK